LNLGAPGLSGLREDDKYSLLDMAAADKSNRTSSGHASPASHSETTVSLPVIRVNLTGAQGAFFLAM
jgi:hypothetical protein